MGCLVSSYSLWLFLCWLDGLFDHLRDVSWDDIFKLVVSAAVSEFCEWIQVGIDLYIPHRKCQGKFHLSAWFSAACAAATVYGNHFLHLYQQNKSSESKVKFRQATSRSKRVRGAVKGVLKLPKLHMLIKQKNLPLSRNLALGTFGHLLIVFSTKVNPLFLYYSTVWRRHLLYLMKQSCLLKTFLRNLILMTWVSLSHFPFYN